MFEKIKPVGDSDKAPQAPARPAPQAPRPAATPASAAPAAPAASSGGHRNRLSNDVEIKGTVRFQDELLVDGKVEGEIISNGALIIQENARLKAEIKVGSVVIMGKVHGNITASQQVELRAGAEVIGDIKTAVLAMEAGSIFVGRSEVGTPTSKPSSGSQPQASQTQKKDQPKQTSNNTSAQGQAKKEAAGAPS